MEKRFVKGPFGCLVEDENGYLRLPDNEEIEEEEIEPLENEDFKVVDASDVSEVIEANFNKLKQLKKSLKRTEGKVRDALYNSQLAKDRKAGILFNKKNIEYIQSALVTLAEAQDALVQTQRISFEYQRALTYFCKYLLFLGATNIATNRKIVSTIEEKLSDAKTGGVTNQEKTELLNVIKDLKSQQDIFEKQERLSMKIKDLNDKVAVLQKQVNSLSTYGVAKLDFNELANKCTEKIEPRVIEDVNKFHPLPLVATIIASIAFLLAAILLVIIVISKMHNISLTTILLLLSNLFGK